MKKIGIILAIAFLLFAVQSFAQQTRKIQIGNAEISIGSLLIKDTLDQSLSIPNQVSINKISSTLYRLLVTVTPKQSLWVSDMAISAKISSKTQSLENQFHWVPNIKFAPDQIMPQHVFRSPCIILTTPEAGISIIPDLKEFKKPQPAPAYLDLGYDKGAAIVKYGLSHYKVEKHVYYAKKKQLFKISDRKEIGFYILISPNSKPLSILEKTNDFLWRTFASEYVSSTLPQTVKFKDYANVAYPMAISHYWVDAGDDKGGIALSTYYDETAKVYRGRDYKDDLWFHSWFNNMRTAYGLYYWGEAKSDDEWKRKAVATANLLLSAPMNEGWFPTIYVNKDSGWIGSGQGGGRDIYHVPDNAWTAYWLLRFNEEQHKVAGSEKFLLDFSKALLKVQNEDGSFPARVNAKTLQPDFVLQHSASSAIATWYLLELISKKKVSAEQLPKYASAIKHSLDFLEKKVLPNQRFEDFELYFSCSRKPLSYYDSSTHLFGQNTLAMQWCAEAYLEAFRIFKDNRYLQNGEYCLNILSLYQQVWNPPFISLYAFGGFGVQNTDAEWSDARQAQFAETYLDYFEATKKKEYLERAKAACRASFALMVLPENKKVAPNNYAGTEMNGESLPGNMAENYGHSGFDERSYQSGFHWGSGSALTTAAIFDHREAKPAK